MPKKKKAKVPVSTRALIARINRKIAKDGEQLRKMRGPARMLSPTYYVVDIQHNFVVSEFSDLEGFGRECGVLRAWEALKQ
jgi:hypothetical protein